MKALIYRKIIDDKYKIITYAPFLFMLIYYLIGEELDWKAWLALVIASQLLTEFNHYRTLNFNKNEYFLAGITYAVVKFIFRFIMITLVTIVFNKSSLEFYNILLPLYAYFLLEILSGVSSFKLSTHQWDEKEKIIRVMIILGIILLGLYTVRCQFILPTEKITYSGIYLTFVAIMFIVYLVLNYQGVDYSSEKNQNVDQSIIIKEVHDESSNL